MIRERYLISKHDLDCINAKIESIEIISQAIIDCNDIEKAKLYAERINTEIKNVKRFLTVGESLD